MIFSVQATITTTSGGAATVYLGSKILGLLVALKYSPGTLDTGAGLTITGEDSGIPILTKASAGTSDVWYYPRAPANQVADGAAITNSAEMVPILSEKIKVVVASGGNEKTGSIEAIFETASPF